MANSDDIRQKILNLKTQKNALILAHYYQPLEVQDVADHVCDSFEMAKRARDAEQQIIVICGVVFMGESAKILNPGKKILIPVMEAGCPMADMVAPENVLRLKNEHPDAAVVCYVNSSATVKAVSDICCTSSSALRIVRSLPEKKIIFVPDRNLGSYVAKQVPEKEIILFSGFCPSHNRIAESDILLAKQAHPKSVFAAHPECREEVLSHADFIGSTSEILDYARRSDEKTIIIGTEQGVVERLRRELPDKNIYSVAASFICESKRLFNCFALDKLRGHG